MRIINSFYDNMMKFRKRQTGLDGC